MADRRLTFSFYGRDISAGRTMRGIAGETDTLRSRSLAAAKAVGVLAGGAALTGLTVTLKTGFRELQDYQGGLSQLRAGLKSTKGAANVSAKGMEALAKHIQDYSGQTDDSIVKTESLLLTFPKIRNEAGKTNDIFDQTTKAAADMAARLGTDASSQAIRLGKALQDPVRGMTALTRAGVVFDDQQRAQITRLVEHNRTLEAQKVILGEVNKEFGGSARAFGHTLPGQIERTKRAYEDISQELATDLLPYALRFTKWLRKDAIPGLEDFGGWIKAHKTEVEWFAGIIGGLAVSVKALKGVRALQSLVGKGPLARGSGLLGKASPVPVYVTNWGGKAMPGGKEPVPAGGRGSALKRILPGPLLLAGAYAATSGGDQNPAQTPMGSSVLRNGPLITALIRAVGGRIPTNQGMDFFRGPLDAPGGRAVNPSALVSNTETYGTADQIKRLKELAKTYPAISAALKDYNQQQTALNKLLVVNPGLAKNAAAANKIVEGSLLNLGNTAKTAGRNIGIDLGQGLIQGVEAQIPHATVAGKLLVSQTVKQMRLAADAHSPSRVTMSLGKDLADGLFIGFTNVKTWDKLSADLRHGLRQLGNVAENARSYRQDFRSNLLGSLSLSGMGGQTDSFGSSMGSPSVHAYIRQKVQRLRQFKHLRQQLEDKGASPALLAEFDELGPGAIPAMREELGTGRKGIRRDNRLLREGRRLAGSTASAATEGRFGPDLERLLERLPHRLATELAHELRHVHIDVNLREHDRKQGKKVKQHG